MPRPSRQRRPAALALAVLLACLVGPLGLSAVGREGRVVGVAGRVGEAAGAIHVVRTAKELQAALERSGVRGRVVVSASRYLHFQEPDLDALWASQDSFPLRITDVVPLIEGRVDVTNHLWVSMRAGLAREVVHVVPPPVFLAKAVAARESPIDVVSVADHAVTLHHWGSRRTITDAVPRLAEPVVLEVDASYFELADPADLVRRLEEARLTADLVTLCLAEDNPDVTSRGREGLAAFAALIRSGGTFGR